MKYVMYILPRSLTVKICVVFLVVIVFIGYGGGVPFADDMEFTHPDTLSGHLSRRQRLRFQALQRCWCHHVVPVAGLVAGLLLGTWSVIWGCRLLTSIADLVSWGMPLSSGGDGPTSLWSFGLCSVVSSSAVPSSPLSCDQDLVDLDQFLDDAAVNAWYAPHQTYQEGKPGRKPIPAASKLRIHVLCAQKHLPSYNEICAQIPRNTVYQAFCGVTSISAGTLSTFRASLSFGDLMALMKLFIRQAEDAGLFETCADLHVQDSTDLESPCNWQVIDTIEHGTQTTNVYHDPTAQLGKRSHKKGKTPFFVGHRKHTLGVVQGTKVIPLLSVVLPADRPDQYALLPLLHLAGMVGLEVRYLVADLAYIDQKRKTVAAKRYGVLVSTDKKVNTSLPEHTDPKTGHPQCFQGEDMTWDGFDPATGEHTYLCPMACPRQDCHYAPLCSGERTIDAESYPTAFRIVPVHTTPVRDMLKKRKAVEPMFRRERQHGGLDNVTVMGKANVHVIACIADICDLLKTLAQLQRPMANTEI